MEKIRKSSDISDVNGLGVYGFRMEGIENDPTYPFPTLLIYGIQGYASYLIDIRFLETVYIACSPSFEYGFIWRMATREEAEEMYMIADEGRAKVYCIEEDISGYVPPLYQPLQRDARKFFIVARGLEITLKYDESFEDTVAGWGQPL
ncbi:MAG: hypothetical protein ACRDIV_17070 [Ktedonobacteraceae bacterium]